MSASPSAAWGGRVFPCWDIISLPSFVWRTDNHAPVGRHGATVQAFDLEMQKQGVDDMDDFGQRRDVAVPDVELLWEEFRVLYETCYTGCRGIPCYHGAPSG